MIRDHLIICIANHWDYDPTSKHQVIRILSRFNEIVWVAYHGSRRPAVSRVDASAAWSVLRRVVRGVRRVAPSIIEVTPLVIPDARHPWLQWCHQRMLIAQIRRAVRSVQRGSARPVQVWTFAPDVPYLVGQFEEECFLYYCVDEYTEFEGFDRDRIAVAEGALLDRADVVVTASESLHEGKRRRRPDAALVRHGVDYDHFASAWRQRLTRPPDLASIPNPMFGFFGLIHHWVDLSLLAQVAQLRPQYSFVLLGDCKVDGSRVRCLPNVFFLGRRPYDRLPAYCAAFDAGLMLFTRSEMTRHVNPIKMLEYLAAGLPVVSTPLPEARHYEGSILIRDTAHRFAAACDEVLRGNDAKRRKSISRLVADETWLSRVERLSEIVSRHVRHTGGTSDTARRGAVQTRPNPAIPTPW